MDLQLTETLQKLMCEMKCDRQFVCVQSGFEKLCLVEDFGVEGYVNCLDEHSTKCKHSLPFGHDLLCKCQIRVFLAKEMDFCERMGSSKKKTQN